LSVRSERRRGSLRASGKADWAWPPVVAVDAGAMQIQSWERSALSGAETVLQGTTHDTVPYTAFTGQSRHLENSSLRSGLERSEDTPKEIQSTGYSPIAVISAKSPALVCAWLSGFVQSPIRRRAMDSNSESVARPFSLLERNDKSSC